MSELPTSHYKLQTSHFQLQTSPDELPPPLPQLSVAKILRTVFPKIESRFKPRTQGVIQRVNLCRTPTLGTHRYRCDPCGRTLKVYNSCGDRHCPLCHGGQRNRWIERNASRLVPQTAYLQIVFTLPDKLSNLILANRGVLYRLLMKTVWDEVKRILLQLGIEPSAMLVLHTWNQRLKHHPHVHVLIPMAGISLDGMKWVSIENDPQFQAGTNWKLSKRFRQTFCRRMNLLNQRGKLNLPGNLAFLKPTQLHYSKDYVSPMQEWLQPIAPHGFRVFVQPPPQFDVKPSSTAASTAASTTASTAASTAASTTASSTTASTAASTAAASTAAAASAAASTAAATSPTEPLLPSPLFRGEGLGMRGLSIDESVLASSPVPGINPASTSSPSPSTTPQRIAMPADCLLKYMARYLGGGPIGDHRLVSWAYGLITFLARSLEDEEADEQLWLFEKGVSGKEQGIRQGQQAGHPETYNLHLKPHPSGINLPLSVTKAKVEYTISEEEFVKRWASHILPPGFIRVQHYGATSRRRCKEYLAQCRKLLGISEADTTHANGNEQSADQTDDGNEQSTGNGNEQSAVETDNGNQPSAAQTDESKAPSVDELEAVLKLMYGQEPEEKPYEPTWKCTKCGKSMQCLEFQLRPSWRVVFERLNHQADKDTQQWLWSLSELHALRDGVAELSVANQEPSTKNQEQRSSKTKNQELRTKNSAAFDSS